MIHTPSIRGLFNTFQSHLLTFNNEKIIITHRTRIVSKSLSRGVTPTHYFLKKKKQFLDTRDFEIFTKKWFYLLVIIVYGYYVLNFVYSFVEANNFNKIAIESLQNLERKKWPELTMRFTSLSHKHIDYADTIITYLILDIERSHLAHFEVQ